MKKFLILSISPYILIACVFYFSWIMLEITDGFETATGFSFWFVLVALLPSIVIGYIAYRFRTQIFPAKGESITAWINSQKKFRVALTVSSALFIVCLIFSFDNLVTQKGWRGSPDFGFWLVSSLISYPLILILLTKYIASSKE